MLNSYMTVEQANAYHNIRMSREVWNTLSDQEKRQRLVSASDFLDFNYRFSGEKAEPTQEREFPRKGFEAVSIPKAVQFAVCELALQENLTANQEAQMSSVRVGPVSVNYDNSSPQNSVNRFEYVKQLLAAWLDRASCGTIKLERS
ncbi:DnaT-like ssDNA-binding protein [Mannheimia sp. HC-2023]|uniref:DnaT-like ssDNA-binding protein n=1 Tax=Mannheimia indoligenes TaxID=3103145 RepID=UPI002FE59E12